MEIICLDGSTYTVKYLQSKEKIINDFGTASFRYPDFVGSRLSHNSTSGDIYSLSFAIHRTLLLKFKESLKKIVDYNNLVTHPDYGKLEHIILEHPSFGAILGNVVGSITYDTSSQADIMCSCAFEVHTPDERIIKKDIQDENLTAINDINSETSSNFNVNLNAQDKSALSRFATKLTSLYTNIQNSSVVSAFNDFESALNSATLDSLRIMNAVKNILLLPNEIMPDIGSKITLLTGQANAIKDIPITSYNLALFNANVLSYNMGITTKTAFISESAAAAAAGIKSVNMT